MAAQVAGGLIVWRGIGSVKGIVSDWGYCGRPRSGCRVGARLDGDDVAAESFNVDVEVEVAQDASCDALVFAREREQDVLGPDVIEPQSHRLAKRSVEHLLGAGRERDRAG